MADRQVLHRWTLRAGYLGLALLIMFIQLLPLRIWPQSLVGPDLLLALTFGFAARRPDYLPALAVAAVMLLADLLLDRPPGLLALLVLAGTEALKSRARGLRDRNFVVEWITVATVLLAILAAQRLVLAVLLVPQVPLTLSLLQAAATIAAYPLVVALAHLALGLNKAHPTELDMQARRT